MNKLFGSLLEARRVGLALGHSLQGLRAAYEKETAFRQELALSIILLPLGFWLGRSGVERALLAGSVLLVLMMEIVNSAVEAVVDRIGSERHRLSGRAKDMGSAAVLVSMLLCILVWALVLLDR